MAGIAASEATEPYEVTLENLFETPGGRRLLTGIQCGVCAGTCP